MQEANNRFNTESASSVPKPDQRVFQLGVSPKNFLDILDCTFIKEFVEAREIPPFILQQKVPNHTHLKGSFTRLRNWKENGIVWNLGILPIFNIITLSHSIAEPFSKEGAGAKETNPVGRRRGFLLAPQERGEGEIF